MAIGDISLTASMRSNLFSLQQTASLLGRTQERLSTGKRVNSALDDPTSFFTAKAHLSDAANLDSLKNGMSEAVQTVKSADTGVTAVTSLIASAKAIAAQAKATADAGAIANKASVLTITTNLSAGDVVTVGGNAFTAVTAITGDGSTQFLVGTDAAGTAANLAALVNTVNETTTMNAVVNGAAITFSRGDGANIGAGDVVGTAVKTSEVDVTVSSGRAALGEQYDEIMSQIAKVVDDAGYNGVNLLNGATESLVVDFGNSHSLTMTGFDGTGGLRGTLSNDWAGGGVVNINLDIAKLDNASAALKVGSSNLSNNLSIVTTRQDWSKNAINVLQTGADNLTLADMNEEGANMLMLQTRQSLGTTSLSLASQAAQSVLRLFG